MHVVVIVGLVMLFVVGVALWLLVKYLIRRTHRWHEHCAERNMERAIHLYNNQEMPPESDYMYTALPPQEAATATVSRRVTSTHRNGHCRQSKNGGYIILKRFLGHFFGSVCVCACTCAQVCTCMCLQRNMELCNEQC